MTRNMGSMSDNALKEMLGACSLVLLILIYFSGCKADDQGGDRTSGETTPSPITEAPGAQLNDAVAAAGTTLSWQACPGDAPKTLECGQMKVPLDWDEPDGEKITIAVNRLEAGKPKRRVGSLVFDAGGPGSPSQPMIQGQAEGRPFFTKRLADRFDLIGLDPRGVGESTPVRCDPEAWNDQPSRYPTNAEEFEAMRASNVAVFESCLERTGPLLGHIDTISAARDIEALRIGLRDGKLNYIGWSYGTQLGSQYAELYPKSIRAMVLDGNVDHSQPEVSALVTEGSTYADALDRFFQYCETTPSCALQGKDAAALFDELVRKADANPIPAPDCLPDSESPAAGLCKTSVTGEDIRFNTQPRLAFPRGWPALDLPGWDALGQAIDDALNRDDASFFSTAKAVDDKFEFFQVRGVECMDWTTDSSRTFADLQSKIVLGRAITPYTDFASQTYDIQTSCLGWGLPPKNPPRPLVVEGAPPILLVNSTHDPEASVVWAVGLKEQLPSAVLALREGDGHLSYILRPGPHETIDAIDRYLITLKTPPPNTVYPN